MGAWEGRRTLIISGAPKQDANYVRTLYEQMQQPLVICADGGMRYAQAAGLRADLVIGDFDSGAADVDCDEVIRLTPEKDDTDTQHCVREAIARGSVDLVLACAMGGRVDHMMGNLFLCEYAWELGASLVIRDQQNCVMYHGGGVQRYKRDPSMYYVSVIPLDRTVTGVTLLGLKYPLQQATLTRAMMISISNEPLEAEFSVEIASGSALIVFSRDA